jgi:hypothetical protein
MRKFLAVGIGVLSLALLPQASEAGVITGILDFSGAIRVNTSGQIDFGNNGFGTAGVFNVANTTTLQNGGGPVLNFGTVSDKDLSAAAQPTTGFAPLDLFESLSADPTIDFVLTDILSCAEIAGAASCPFGDVTSPFSFAQAGFSVTVTMVMSGTVFSTLTPGLVSDWGGTFTAQFPGTQQNPTTVAGLLAQFLAVGYIDTSISASKITTQQPVVPEPATLLTFGIGSGILALRRRRKAQAKVA